MGCWQIPAVKEFKSTVNRLDIRKRVFASFGNVVSIPPTTKAVGFLETESVTNDGILMHYRKRDTVYEILRKSMI